MSLACYYNQLKLAREIALVKPALAEVTICSHKRRSVSIARRCTEKEEVGGPQPAGTPASGVVVGGCTVTHGVYTELSTSA